MGPLGVLAPAAVPKQWRENLSEWRSRVSSHHHALLLQVAGLLSRIARRAIRHPCRIAPWAIRHPCLIAHWAIRHPCLPSVGVGPTFVPFLPSPLVVHLRASVGISSLSTNSHCHTSTAWFPFSHCLGPPAHPQSRVEWTARLGGVKPGQTISSPRPGGIRRGRGGPHPPPSPSFPPGCPPPPSFQIPASFSALGYPPPAGMLHGSRTGGACTSPSWLACSTQIGFLRRKKLLNSF